MTLPSLIKNILLLGVTAAAVAAAVDPACWRRAVHAEGVDDGGDGGPATKSGGLAWVGGHGGWTLGPEDSEHRSSSAPEPPAEPWSAQRWCRVGSSSRGRWRQNAPRIFWKGAKREKQQIVRSFISVLHYLSVLDWVLLLVGFVSLAEQNITHLRSSLLKKCGKKTGIKELFRRERGGKKRKSKISKKMKHTKGKENYS